MKNFLQGGELATVVAPAAVASGDFVVVGALYGVAQTDALINALVPIVREGVFTLPKSTAAAWTAGDQLYWDAGAGKFTKVAAGNKPVGIAYADALIGDTTGSVSIDEVPAGLANAIAGAGAGYKIARGETSVTGATAGDVDTGLATVVAVVASLGEDAAIGGNLVTAALGGVAGHITLKVWKPTAVNDATPILSTAAKKVDWIAIGT